MRDILGRVAAAVAILALCVVTWIGLIVVVRWLVEQLRVAIERIG